MRVNKWWLLVVQGILLIILSYFLFTRAKQVIATTVDVIAIIALLTGAIIVFGYFFGNPSERDSIELWSGVFSGLAGIFFLAGGSLASQLAEWFYAAILLLNVLMIVQIAWNLKSEIKWWWITLLLLSFALLLLYHFATGKLFLGTPTGQLAGILFLALGLLTIRLAFILRKLETEYSKTIREIIDQKNK